MSKTALVTGSSRGIGRAIALKLAEDGFDVVVNYRVQEERAVEVVEKIRSMGRKCIAIKCDIRNFEEVENMFSEIKRQFNHIDVLVNNAGIANTKLFQDFTPQEWYDIINTNVNGMFHCTHFAIKDMLERHKGQILNISSIWGIVGCAMEVPYATSKGAVISFTKSIAREYGYSGIQANCIAPGGVDTEMLDELSDEVLDNVVEETPFGRLATVDDVANLASFLISEKAEYITGQVISPNGGFIIY